MTLRRSSCRGVWKAPFPGPHGETYVYAVASHGALITDPIPVPLGGDAEAVADGLWTLLNQQDPGGSFASRPPLFGRLSLRHPNRGERLHLAADGP
jgi:hypothetical protein